MKFDSDIGKLQRLMAESIAGTSRRNAILSEMRIQPGDTIIDVGCGAGHLLPHLAKAVGGSGTIYGLDPNTDQMEQAKKRCEDFQNIIFIEENADKSDLQDESCDSATSTQALEYIPNVDAALDEITRIIKPGGAFVNIVEKLQKTSCEKANQSDTADERESSDPALRPAASLNIHDQKIRSFHQNNLKPDH